MLEIEGKVMSETSAIARYVARKYGYYPDDIDSQYEVDNVTSSIDHCMYMGAKAFWILQGDEKKKAVQNLREVEVRQLYQWLSDRLNEKENKQYLVGDRITYADFRLFSFFLGAIRELEPEALGSLLAEFPVLYRYLNSLKHNEFNSYIRRCRDTEFGISVEERSIINQIYDFWFDVKDLNIIAPQQMNKRWFNGGEQMDNECKAFQEHVEKAIAGEYDHWAKEPYGRLVLILLLDQFPRNIFRKKAEAFSGDLKAQQLTKEGLEKGLFWLYSCLERDFFLLPLMHAEDRELADLSVEYSKKHVELSLKIYPEFGKEADTTIWAIKHRDVVAKFGRYPYRNQALGRETTPEELEYLKYAERFGQ